MGERTPHAAWCHGATKAKAKDNAETQRAGRFRRGTPHPPVFCEKRLQADENKGSKPEKESEEKPRGGKSLRERNLRQEHRNSAGDRAVAAKTHGVAEERSGETGTLSA
jgi:hypothetical protein